MEAALRPAVAGVVLFALAATVLSSCGSDDSASSPTATTSQDSASPAQGRSLISITIADNSYTPSNLTVPKGTAVTWAWEGKNAHSVTGTWDGATVESKQQRAGTFAVIFEKVGSFDYQCGIHGSAMSGKVTVKE